MGKCVIISMLIFLYLETGFGETAPKEVFSDIIKNGGVCRGNNSNAVIQFVLVQDATGTYKGFLTHLETLMPRLLSALTKEFPETQFALTSFVDYPNGFNRPSPSAYCYRLFQPFTYDHSLITSGIRRIKVLNGGYDDAESSLTGILYTATDRRIGWSHSQTRNGKRIYKVIVVTTDESWKSKEEPGIEKEILRPDAKGDGTDTCANYPPSVSLVKEVLDLKDIFLFGLIGGAKTEVWKKYFLRYGFKKSRTRVVELDPNEADSIAKILTEEFSRMITQQQCYAPKINVNYKGVDNMTNFMGKNLETVFSLENDTSLFDPSEKT